MAATPMLVNPAGWSFHEPPEAGVRWRHYRHKGSPVVPNALEWMDPSGDIPETVEILSVTQALGVIDKSQMLQHYAAKMTIQGVSKILRDYGLEKTRDGHLPSAVDLEDLCMVAEDPEYLKDQLKRHHLMFYNRTDDAARRGTAVHTVLEDWVEHGKLPDPKEHPEPYRGYVRGLGAFLLRERPTFLESELIVGSTYYGVAGARDTVLVLHDKQRGRCLVDLKTSKGVYPSSHFRQLTAYDRLGVEGGSDPTDAQGILRVGEDGSHELVWLQDSGTPEFYWHGFLRALACQRDERAIKKIESKMYREAQKAAKEKS